MSTRRLARELGVSTAAVYTYFGSVEQLRYEVRLDGFARLRSRLEPFDSPDDPVAALAGMVVAFFDFGMLLPHLYRAMFVDRPPEDDDAGAATFERLKAIVQHGVEAGRFTAVAATQAELCAAQVWSMPHGMVTMVLSGAVPANAAREVLLDMASRMAIGYGDDRRAAARSVATVTTTRRT